MTSETLGPGVGGLKTVTGSQQSAVDVGNVCGRVAATAVVTDYRGTDDGSRHHGPLSIRPTRPPQEHFMPALSNYTCRQRHWRSTLCD